MTKIKQIYLLVEGDDDKVYSAILSDRQILAIKSILATLPEPVQLLEEPLAGIEIRKPGEDKKNG